MLGSQDKRYICLGPASGFGDHYGETLQGFVRCFGGGVATLQAIALGAGSARVVGVCLQRGTPCIAALAGMLQHMVPDFCVAILLCCAVSRQNPGHFDILMGKRVEKEVFPLIHQFLLQHDSPKPRL